MKRSKSPTSESRALARPRRRSRLLRDIKGGTDFVEKLILIGFFAIAVVVGVQYIAGKANSKFQGQGDYIEGSIPQAPAAGEGGG
jgi:Flp pilus assembly pilin Flp